MSRRGLRYAVLVVVGLTLFSGVVAGEPFVDLDPDSDLAGEGTDEDPYQIENSSELQAMAGNLSANYTLVADIDASNTSAWDGGAGFEPVGNDTEGFSGRFDGDGYTIDGLTVNRSSTDAVGLFGGATTGATLSNVSLEAVDIHGGQQVGGLVGNLSDGDLTDSSVDGSVVGDGDQVGGLVGAITNSTVSDSFTTASVEGSTAVGGLVGAGTNSTLRNTFGNGSVEGTNSVGGLVGNLSDDTGTATIELSYAAGSVDGDSVVGGVVGNSSSTDIASSTYWDSDTLGPTNGIGSGTGNPTALSTARMTGNNATITGNMDALAFYDAWVPTDSYPQLTWQFFDEMSGEGSESDPYRVDDSYGLQAITVDLDASYTLSGSINLSETVDWNDGAGFEPIANGSQFSGSIDGGGHTISDLTINRGDESTSAVGLFSSVSSSGSLTDVHLSDSSVTGNVTVGGITGVLNGTVTDSSYDGMISGVARVGGLIGLMETNGSVTDVRVTGNITVLNEVDTQIASTNPDSPPGSTEDPFGVGGLIGESTANVSKATTDVSITVANISKVGGLVGVNSLRIESSRSDGSITADSGDDIGGIIGVSEDSSDRPFSNLRATVNITAVDSSNVGGLVGRAGGTSSNPTEFENVSARGDVTGNEKVGGLLGNGEPWTIIRNSSATGTVSGSTNVGGLVGRTESDIFRSFATGDVKGNTTSGTNVGGLVGRSYGPTGNTSSHGNVTGNDVVGGLVGYMDGSVANSFSVGEVSGNANNGSFAGRVAGTDTVDDSFFDESTSGVSAAVGDGSDDGITGLSTVDLQGSAATENTNLSFNPVWIATDGYPIHVWRVDDYELSVGQTTLDPGETTASTVTLSLADESTTTATEPAGYSSTNTDSITVDDGGQVTAADSGSATLTATASGFDDTLSLSVIAPSSPSTSSSSSSSSDDDDNEPPDEPSHNETTTNETTTDETTTDEATTDGTTGSDSSTESETDDTEDAVVESVDEPRRFSAVEIGVGGGASVIGTYVLVVLVSRTELFVAAAPASVAKAVAAVPGTAGFLLAEPEQAAFVVGSVTLADSDHKNDDDSDVTAGETVAIDVTIENKGDIPGARVVTLTLNEPEDSATVDIPAHTAHSVGLNYQTSLADAGKTLGFTIDCETDSTDIDIAVGELTDTDDESMSKMTTDPDDAGTDEQTSGEAVDPETTDDEEIDTEVSEDELDEGTRTGFVDRLWLQKGKILSYTAGLIIIYIGTTNLETNVFAGGLGIFLGVMALPIVRAQLPTSTRVLISRYGKVVVVIIAALFSGVLVDPAVVFERIQELFR